jgi:hypothetical protein
MLPVVQVMPSSVSTVGMPMSGTHGPPVLRLTTSFSVPGSLPWHFEITPPTVRIGLPLILVRVGASPMPSAGLAVNGYGNGMGLGAAGVVHTLTAAPTI